MTTVSPFARFFGHVLDQSTAITPLVITYGHIILSALFPIYIGAHASLSSATARPSKEPEEVEWEDDDKKGHLRKMEGLRPSDALVFPLMAGLILGSLYLVIKWLEDPAVLSKALNIYYSQIGIFLAASLLKDGFSIIRSFVFPRRYWHDGEIWQVLQAKRIFVPVKEVDNPIIRDVQVRHSPLPAFLGLLPLPEWVQRYLWLCRDLMYRIFSFHVYMRRLAKISFQFSLLDVVAGILALVVVIYFTFVTKPWWLTNFLGFSFCYGALQLMSPSTFWTGSLILASLFLYDIYFVFFTPVMVTVATKLDVPMKLLFPRPPRPCEDPSTVSTAMLGLGDIVIPGMMIGLALRYDLFLHYQRKAAQKAQLEGHEDKAIKPQYQPTIGGWGERFWVRSLPSVGHELDPPYSDARSFSKTYFYSSLVGYTISMSITLLVMHYWNHAQPALLYLVPGVLISLWGTAFVRGDLGSMWTFSDSDEEGEDTEQIDRDDKAHNSPYSISQSIFIRLWTESVKPFANESEQSKKEEGRIKEKAETSTGSLATLTGETVSAVVGIGEEKKRCSSKNRTSSQEKRHDEDHDDDSVLISFSISLPRRRPTRRRKEPSASETLDRPLLIERDGEPPAKRRRPSPKGSSS